MIFEFRNIAWFIGLIVAQIFFIDYLDFGIYSSYFSPIIICFFILKMKLDTTVINLLIYAFFLGFITDIFRNTLGLNTSVLLIITFLKPTFLYSISSKEDIEKDVELNIKARDTSCLARAQMKVASVCLEISLRISKGRFKNKHYPYEVPTTSVNFNY